MVVIILPQYEGYKSLKEPTLFSKNIQLSTELSLTFDMGLACKTQLLEVTNKAYWAFWMCTSTFGKT
jgi:hypothetical protein